MRIPQYQRLFDEIQQKVAVREEVVGEDKFHHKSKEIQLLLLLQL
jgi:hypothetical protein